MPPGYFRRVVTLVPMVAMGAALPLLPAAVHAGGAHVVRSIIHHIEFAAGIQRDAFWECIARCRSPLMAAMGAALPLLPAA